jgi:hypothetical protein
VRYLQQVLNAIRGKYALVTFEPLEEDGYMGPLTEGAVDDTLHAVWDVLSSAGYPYLISTFEDIPGVYLGSLAVWSGDGRDAEVTNARRLAEWFQTYVLTDSGSLLS